MLCACATFSGVQFAVGSGAVAGVLFVGVCFVFSSGNYGILILFVYLDNSLSFYGNSTIYGVLLICASLI